MKKAVIIATLLFLSAITFAELPKVAVLDAVLPGDIEASVSVGVTEKISEEFVNSGKYTVLDRTTVGQSLKEIEFQTSGLVSDAEIRKAGQQLNSRLGASFVVIAQVSKVGGTFFITAKLIDIKTGEIVAQASSEAEGEIAVTLRIAQTVGKKLATGIRESKQLAKESQPSVSEPSVSSGAGGQKHPWDPMVGTWMVVTSKRPAGWNDSKYIFTPDGRLEIYHTVKAETYLQYRGAIVSVEKESIKIKTEYQKPPSNIAEMTMNYRFISENRLRIGWGGVYYLELKLQ